MAQLKKKEPHDITWENIFTIETKAKMGAKAIGCIAMEKSEGHKENLKIDSLILLTYLLMIFNL